MARVAPRGRPSAMQRVIRAAGAHHPGHQVEPLQSRRLHRQQPVLRRHQVDLAFPGRLRKGHPLPGHGPGKGQGGLVFVHPLRPGAVFAHHVEVVPAHLLQPAEIPHPDDLPLFHRRPFAEPRDDLGHVVQGPPAHGLLQRHRLQGRGLTWTLAAAASSSR